MKTQGTYKGTYHIYWKVRDKELRKMFEITGKRLVKK